MESMLAHVSGCSATLDATPVSVNQWRRIPENPSSSRRAMEWTFTRLTTTEGVCLLLVRSRRLRAKLAVKSD
jgi:hypothetical protein